MKIKRLYIGDMGIFRNALMENVAPGLVVIGGLNRAGKTTFLEILRHLPYGFTRRLRSCTAEPSVECDFEEENGKVFSAKLKGYGEPRISLRGNNESTTLKNIYNDIDRFTYSQLYTITLDELRKLNIKGEEEKLQSVLLGAGVREIVHIPKLLEEISEEKVKIGGKLGNPNVKLFKPYYEKINEGLEAKDSALKQIDRYASLKVNEAEIQHNIEELVSRISSLKAATELFDVLESYFDDYSAADILKQEVCVDKNTSFQCNFDDLPTLEKIEAMYEEYLTALNEYTDIKSKFEGNQNEAINYEELLKSEEKIIGFIKNISGLKQKRDELTALKKSYEADKQSILEVMLDTNNSFNGDFIKVLDIECDLINEGKLLESLEEAKAVDSEVHRWKASLETERLQSEAIKESLKAAVNYKVNSFYRYHFYASVGILFLSFIVYFLNKSFSLGLLLIGFIFGGLYFYIKQSSINQINSKRMSLELEYKTSEEKQRLYIKKIDNLHGIKQSLKYRLTGFKKDLQLSEDTPDLIMLQYFNNIKVLKGRILELGGLGRKIQKQELQLSEELEEIADTISSFIDFHREKRVDILKISDEIFITLEKLEKEINAAKTFYSAKTKLSAVEVRLQEKLKLNKSEEDLVNALAQLLKEYRIFNDLKESRSKLNSIEGNLNKVLGNEKIIIAFDIFKSANNINIQDNLEFLYYMFNKYQEKYELKKEMLIYNEQLHEALRSLEQLKEELQLIKIEVSNLAASEKVEEAQRLIDEGRLGLKPLAVKYSVYHAAEHILQAVQQDFLDNAKHKLLKGAGDIFSKITSGQYKTVLPGDNLLQTEYKAIGADENTEEASILSRGTAEQLYLSVRLSRIKELKNKVPIVLDDPFVNFDELHVKNTLDILSELSRENQIFILTCHTELIKLISNIKNDIQYWKLIKGKFEPSSSKELYDYLSKV